MSALKKFLPGKKKSKKSTSSSIQSGASEPNLADLGQMLGYKNVKEKDLPKLHKAAWIGDLNKLKQLLKKGDANSMDRHHRYVIKVMHLRRLSNSGFCYSWASYVKLTCGIMILTG